MSKVGFIPLGKRVLVERDEAIRKTASGIIMAGNGEVQVEGTVIAIGNVDLKEFPLKVDDRVMLQQSTEINVC